MNPPILEFEFFFQCFYDTFVPTIFRWIHEYICLRVRRSRIDGLRDMHMFGLPDQFPKQLYQFTLIWDYQGCSTSVFKVVFFTFSHLDGYVVIITF